MARLHLLSDLHLEFSGFVWPRVEADVTLLAGDTHTGGRCINLTDAETELGRPVVMIAGNHEFYGAAIDREIAKLKAAAEHKRVTFLDNEEIVLAGVRILGATLWTDFRLFADGDDARAEADASRCVGGGGGPAIADFRRIRAADDGGRLFSPRNAARLHDESVAWLDRRLSEPYGGPTIVMTHHAPAARCVPLRYAHDVLSCAFASRLEWLIEKHQPDLWLWGHIHDSYDFRMGRTRMISNPRGYVTDEPNPSFQPGLVIEIG